MSEPFSTELVRADTGSYAAAKRVRSAEDAREFGRLFADSGWWGDAKDPSKAAVKVLLGSELGLSPVLSMTNLHVLDSKQGPKITIGVHAMAALVRRSGRYDYRIIEKTPKRCEIEYSEIAWEVTGQDGRTSKKLLPIGRSAFTWDDAIKAELAGKPNYQHHPADMLYARCQASGIRTFCPDVLSGAVYAEGEIDGDSRPLLNGDAIDAEARVVRTVTDEDVSERVVATRAVQTTEQPVAKTVAATTVAASTVSFEEVAEAVGLKPGDEHPLAPDAKPAQEVSTLVVADADERFKILTSDLLPVDRAGPLAKRVADLVDPASTLAEQDLKDVNSYLKEFFGIKFGRDREAAGARAAWKAVLGAEPKKGMKVTRDNVVTLALHLLSK